MRGVIHAPCVTRSFLPKIRISSTHARKIIDPARSSYFFLALAPGSPTTDGEQATQLRGRDALEPQARRLATMVGCSTCMHPAAADPSPSGGQSVRARWDWERMMSNHDRGRRVNGEMRRSRNSHSMLASASAIAIARQSFFALFPWRSPDETPPPPTGRACPNSTRPTD